MSISKILVANRSEIAIRVFRAANELGLKTVAIWAEEDKLSLHRFKADESYRIGRGPHLSKDMGPIESYLSIEEIIRVAKLSGADRAWATTSEAGHGAAVERTHERALALRRRGLELVCNQSHARDRDRHEARRRITRR